MAIGAGALAAIGIGGTLLSQGGNAYAQGKMNKKTRQWNEKMHFQSRLENYADWEKEKKYADEIWNKQNQYNEEMWQRQNQYNEGLWDKENAYNSPIAQMERYKAAGLNPNLIYGQMSNTGSIATAQYDSSSHGSPSTKEASTSSWNPRAPQFDLQQGIMSYFDAEAKQAQISNLKKQGELMDKQGLAILINSANKEEQTKGYGLKNKYFSDTMQTSADALNFALKKDMQQYDFAANQESRNQSMHTANLWKIGEEIKNLKTDRGLKVSQQELNHLEGELKHLQLNLQRNGIQPTDNMLFRILGQWYDRPLNDKGVSIKDLLTQPVKTDENGNNYYEKKLGN